MSNPPRKAHRTFEEAARAQNRRSPISPSTLRKPSHGGYPSPYLVAVAEAEAITRAADREMYSAVVAEAEAITRAAARE